MRYRPLGRTGIEVSEIGFGAWAIGGGMWGPQDDRTSVVALRRALELGCTFIDTALIYGDGHSEKLVAQALREAHPTRPVAIATKVPPKNRRWPAPRGLPLEEAYDPAYIEGCLDLSLRNLAAERIDLLQLHVWDEGWAARDDWYEAMVRLKERGKIRAIGISLNALQANSGVAVVELGRVDAVQVVYNIFEQAPQDQLLPACGRMGVGVIARVPFDESSLTGKLTAHTRFAADDFRRHYFRSDRLQQTVERVEKLRGLVPRGASTLARLALRFCLSRTEISSVIPGIRSARQAEENCAASDEGPLDEGTLAELTLHRWDRTS
ncbi:MAG: aldo/keto reductase [Deltaproteobacteria bacterium]|nr:aldo/keto reductase [Deltaproteobacteria bacterium]